MARPPRNPPVDTVRAARDLFWEQGYEATSLGDLERATGLNRSSLYQRFGSKRGLFDAALANYLTEVAEPRLLDLEGPDAAATEILGYLRALADSMRAAPRHSGRGCLMVNTITELADRDPAARALGASYRQRIRDAIGNAYGRAAARNELDAELKGRRTDLLTGVVIGVMVTSQLSTTAAADLADAAADQTARWLTGDAT